jgi:hypothetical protein
MARPNLPKYEKTQEFVKLAGGSTRVAKILGLTPGAVNNWKRVPEKHVMEFVSLLESHKLIARDIRPDLYGT